MDIRRIVIGLTLIMLSAAATPLALADDGTFTHHGRITTFFGGTYVISQTQEFSVHLEKGATVTATVAWFDDSADLDLMFVAPAGACDVLPEPDAACLIASSQSRIDGAACEGVGHTGGFPLTPGPETATFTAKVSGLHKVGVAAAFAEPLGAATGYGVDYVLTVDVDGTHGAFSGPTGINYLRVNHCRLLA